MTNEHHKYIVKVTLIHEWNGKLVERTYNRLCNNGKTRDQTLKRWTQKINAGTFLPDNQTFEVVKEPWVELR